MQRVMLQTNRHPVDVLFNLRMEIGRLRERRAAVQS